MERTPHKRQGRTSRNDFNKIVPMSAIARRPLGVIAAIVLSAAGAPWSATAATVTWKGGAGTWDDARRWGGAIPAPRSHVAIDGESQVGLHRGHVVLARLDLGEREGSNASLMMDGGSLMAMEH